MPEQEDLKQQSMEAFERLGICLEAAFGPIVCDDADKSLLERLDLIPFDRNFNLDFSNDQLRNILEKM